MKLQNCTVTMFFCHSSCWFWVPTKHTQIQRLKNFLILNLAIHEAKELHCEHILPPQRTGR
jgi:hypothetical protein